MERVKSKLWYEFKDQLEALNYALARLKLKFEVMDNSIDFMASNGIQVDNSNIPALFAAIDRLDQQAMAMNIAYSYTQNLVCGARYSANYPGDFDLVVQPGALSAQELAAAKVDLAKLDPSLDGLGIAPFIVITGVTVIALITGAITTVSVMSAIQKELETSVDLEQLKLENKIAETPENLPAWAEYKQTTQGEQRSIIDKLFGKGSGKSILASAAGIGLLLIGGLFIMKAIEKKRSTA